MGTTGYYALPYPELTDPPDGAGQIKSLATAIENLLKAGFIIPGGNLTIGDAAAGTSRAVNLDMLNAGKVYRSKLYNAALAGPLNAFTAEVQVDGARKAMLQMAENGQLSTFLGADNVTRPVPFAMAAGTVTLSVSNEVYKAATCTFPVGRFTAAPIVMSICYNNVAFYGYATASTTASVSVGLCYRDNVGATATIGANWTAIQMLPAATPGLRTAEPEYTHTVTCHTEDCGNTDAAIPVIHEPDNDVVCGVCSQTITDITDYMGTP